MSSLWTARVKLQIFFPAFPKLSAALYSGWQSLFSRGLPGAFLEKLGEGFFQSEYSMLALKAFDDLAVPSLGWRVSLRGVCI
jgi:hypothetical protein